MASEKTQASPMEPYQYSKRILLVVTGLSPQVVTETLYALAVKQDQPFVPTEVHVITTAEGAQRARLTLLTEEPGWFHRLCADYSLTGIDFTADHIHVIRDEHGIPLTDIRTPEENTLVADQISELVRDLSQAEDAALHLSIAGGRKTMGFYMGYALSLYGRPQDCLSHVLVGGGFESLPDFYYPTPESHVIFTGGPNSRPLDASEADVTLANIPFVRLREGLPEDLLDGAASFSATIAASQRLFGPTTLQLYPKRSTITCGDLTIELNHADMAFYAFMAKRAIDGKPPVRWMDVDWHEEYLNGYAKIVSPDSAEYVRVETALTGDDGKEYFEQRKSRTNTALQKKLGKAASEAYKIHAFGKRPETRFGLKIDEESIHFVSSNKKPGGNSE